MQRNIYSTLIKPTVCFPMFAHHVTWMKGKGEGWEEEKEAPPEQASGLQVQKTLTTDSSLSFVMTTGPLISTEHVATDNCLFWQVCFVFRVCLGHHALPGQRQHHGNSTRSLVSFQGLFGVSSQLPLKYLKHEGLRQGGNLPLPKFRCTVGIIFFLQYLALSNRLERSLIGEAIIWIHSVGLALRRFPTKHQWQETHIRTGCNNLEFKQWNTDLLLRKNKDLTLSYYHYYLLYILPLLLYSNRIWILK